MKKLFLFCYLFIIIGLCSCTFNKSKPIVEKGYGKNIAQTEYEDDNSFSLSSETQQLDWTLLDFEELKIHLGRRIDINTWKNQYKDNTEVCGEASKMIEQIMKKYKKGCSVAETADVLEENPSVIEQIYDILRQNAPDYDVQKIYQLLLKKNTQDSLT